MYTEAVELDPDERTQRNVFDHDATGAFVVTAQLSNGTAESYEWDLNEQPDAGWVSISIEAEVTIGMTYATA